jgi:type IV secretory pathway TraG/TraD family ATPase VirD4
MAALSIGFKPISATATRNKVGDESNGILSLKRPCRCEVVSEALSQMLDGIQFRHSDVRTSSEGRSEGDQRLWFVVDELDALGAIDGLKDALARLRKFGGRTIIGLHSIAQVSGTYGKAAADTIVENTANTLILRCSASERGGTSEFASKLIGQREVLHTTRSTSRRFMDWFASTTESEHLKIEPAIMASEIERLPDLGGFLKLASIPDWMRVKLQFASYPTVDVPLREAATSAPAAPVPPTVQSNVTEAPATAPTPPNARPPLRKRARKDKQPNGPSKE